MSYRVVMDSCGELTEGMKKSGNFVTASLILQVDEYTIVDDESFDQADFLAKIAASPNCPKSSCPSPEAYREAYDCGADHVFAVTLSSELSGSYNSAMLGRNLYLEDHPEAKVYVFNSRSASVGQTLIGLKIQECENAGMDFESVVETVESYIVGQDTWFVLENLETLRKNGRLSTVKALVATALKIKPIMGSTDEGTIVQLGQARGINRAIVQMVEIIAEKVENAEEKVLGIANCNCRERALMVKEALQKQIKFKDVVIVDTAGVSSMYANDGGVIMAV